MRKFIKILRNRSRYIENNRQLDVLFREAHYMLELTKAGRPLIEKCIANGEYMRARELMNRNRARINYAERLVDRINEINAEQEAL